MDKYELNSFSSLVNQNIVMIVFDTFSIIICLLIGLLLVLIFKASYTTSASKNQIYLSEITLCELLVKEREKSLIISGNLKLADDLNESLFNRLLKICRQLLSIQNLIFEKPI